MLTALGQDGAFGQTVLNIVNSLPPGQQKQALDLLSGQNAAQNIANALASPQAFLGIITNRMLVGMNDGPGNIRVANAGLQLSDAGALGEGSVGPSDKGGVWARAYGVFGHADATSAGAAFDQNRYGGVGGLDVKVADNILVGGAFDYHHTQITFADASGKTDVDSYALAGYGSYWTGPIYVSGVFGFSFNDYGTSQNSFTGANARFSGRSEALYVEGGYRLNLDAAEVTPFLGLGYTHASVGSFTTNGAAPLQVSSASGNSAVTTLGARASIRLGTVVPEARLAWQHEFADSSQKVTAAFVTGGASTPFTIVGSNFGRDSALVGAGVTAELSSSSRLFLDYNGKLNGSFQQHAVTGGFRVNF